MRTAFVSRLLTASLLMGIGALSSPAFATENWQEYGSEASEANMYNQITDGENWQVTVGAGAGFAPSYEGSDELEFSPVPVLDASFEDGLFYAGLQGIGVSPLRGENYSLKAGLSYGGGRDEEDDRDALRGLGDIDGSALAVVSGEYTFFDFVSLGAQVQSGFTGDYGTTADMSIGTGYPITEKLFIGGDIHTTWADDEHMENYFGVSRLQSMRSGKRQFTAESGFKSYGVSISSNYAITENWGILAVLGVDQLTGDAGDSPITQDEMQPSGFIAATYTF